MQISHFLSIIFILTGLYLGSNIAYALQADAHQSISENTLEQMTMNSTEFKQRVTECNGFLGVDYNATASENNSGFRGARVSFAVTISNGTYEGIAFYLNHDMEISSILEYSLSNFSINYTIPSGYTGLRTDADYGGSMVGNHTSPIPKCTLPYKTTKSNIETPLKQFKSGTDPKDVKCSNNLTLVIKSEDGYPACVKGDTASILIERGWAKAPQ
jgi:hypothetical protein